jgi:hypothetical protein
LEIVLSAIKKEYYALKYTSIKLRDDRDIVQTAILSYEAEISDFFSLKEDSFDKSRTLNYIKTSDPFKGLIGKSLLKDKEIILALVRANGWLIEKLPKEWSNDTDVKSESKKSIKRYMEL